MSSRKDPTPSFVLELEFGLAVDVPRVRADKKGRVKDSTAGNNVDATTSADRAIVSEYDRWRFMACIYICLRPAAEPSSWLT